MMAEQRETFDVFCRTHYGAGNDNTQEGCSRSETITAAKGWKIVTLLKSDPVLLNYSSKFKHWVKQRGFQLISHQALGLSDVLCLPAKKKVS